MVKDKGQITALLEAKNREGFFQRKKSFAMIIESLKKRFSCVGLLVELEKLIFVRI